MADFFISYNKNDRQWAEWIAWTLEDAGYSVVIQAWDFRPGQNFVLQMQKALAESKATLAVLSQSYLDAFYTQSEWAATLAQDPKGTQRKLIPVRVAPCEPQGLLKPSIFIDLVGLSEDAAKAALLNGLLERAKPKASPAFPGTSTPRPVFPGYEIYPTPPPSPPSLPREDPPPPPPPPGPPPSVSWTGVLILAGCIVILLGVSLWQADRIRRFDLGVVAIVIYVLLGLIAAVVLFGQLKSSGLLKGNAFGTQIEFGGPAAVVIVFLLAGINLRGGDPFTAQFVFNDVKEHDKRVPVAGQIEITLKSRMFADVKNGYADMPGIPHNRRGDVVTLVDKLEDGYAVTNRQITLDPDNPIVILVSRIPDPPPPPNELQTAYRDQTERLQELLRKDPDDLKDKEIDEIENLTKSVYGMIQGSLGPQEDWKEITYPLLKARRPRMLKKLNIPRPE